MGKLFLPMPEDVEATAKLVIDAAYKVHTALGAGLLESAYEVCLAYELTKQGSAVETQILLPVQYEGLQIDAGYRIDMLVNKHLIVEIKAVDMLMSVHSAQILTYLKLSKLRLGLLINFNVAHLRDGIHRLVN